MDRSRILRAVLVPLAVLMMTACDRGETDPTPDPSLPTQVPTETSTIAAPLGSYRYEGLGVAAVLTLDGAVGELRVRNDTDVELGEPGLYLFTADGGERVELTTRDPAPVAPGPAATFEVAFDEEPPPIGMVFLVLGDDDFGAFVPVEGAGA